MPSSNPSFTSDNIYNFFCATFASFSITTVFTGLLIAMSKYPDATLCAGIIATIVCFMCKSPINKTVNYLFSILCQSTTTTLRREEWSPELEELYPTQQLQSLPEPDIERMPPSPENSRQEPEPSQSLGNSDVSFLFETEPDPEYHSSMSSISQPSSEPTPELEQRPRTSISCCNFFQIIRTFLNRGSNNYLYQLH
jgi:hypothetical protein